MNKPITNGGILSKALKSRKKLIVIAENIFGSNSLYCTVPTLEKIYSISFELSKFQFQVKHRDALKMSESEMERIRQHLAMTLNIDVDGDARDLVEGLIAKNLMTSNEIIAKYGEGVEVVAQQQLTAVKVIILYYPEYIITKENYLPIRGGNKILEEVTLRTKEQFENVVPGRWKWNLGNWVNRQAALSVVQKELPIQSSNSQIWQAVRDPLEQKAEEREKRREEYRNEMEIMRTLEIQRQEASEEVVQQQPNNELSVSDYDDFFN